MSLRNLFLALSIALLIGGLGMAPMASASTINYDATLTGYTYMGGGNAKQSTSDALNPNQMTYFKAGPLTYVYEGSDMWGYAWVKFDDVGTETVESASLAIDFLAVGSMALEDASEEYPGSIDVYSPGDIDVEDLWASSANAEKAQEATDLRSTLHDTLLGSDTIAAASNITSNGLVYIDITEIYNAWVTGELANNGLILSSSSENNSGDIGPVGAYCASFGSSEGVAPYIVTTSAVPVPGTLLLLISGLAGLVGIRRKNS